MSPLFLDLAQGLRIRTSLDTWAFVLEDVRFDFRVTHVFPSDKASVAAPVVKGMAMTATMCSTGNR
jgi:hypothetical protein